jgi:hypothetical protein
MTSRRTFLLGATAALASASAPASVLEVSVRDHGARGDGRTDDRAAIQRAIDAARAAGGGTVRFPEGVYLVTAPEKRPWKPQVTLGDGLTLRGEGMDRSILKVADDQGAYDVLLAGVGVRGLTLTDLGIDANGATNPARTEGDSVASPYIHAALHLHGARDVTLRRCRFANLSGVWAVFASEGMRDVRIEGCRFERIGGFTENDWDHSTIYVRGEGIVVADNVFASRLGPGTTGARTAAELHGSRIAFTGNHISGYRYGVNACTGGEGNATAPSVRQRYADNTMTGVGCGFALWGIRNRRFADLAIERNDITIDVAGWRAFFPEFYGVGVVSYRGTPPPSRMEGVRIADNRIAYAGADGGEARSVGVRLDLAAYTDRWSERPAGRIDGLEVVGNTISGAPAAAIDVNADGSKLTIAGNTLVDPARVVADPGRRSAIRLRGEVEGVRIADNTIEAVAARPLACAIRDEAEHRGARVVSGNRVTGPGSDAIPLECRPPARAGDGAEPVHRDPREASPGDDLGAAT